MFQPVKDKRIKTSIYTEDKKTAESILNVVLKIISKKFDKELMSVTTNGIKRSTTLKRTNALFKI